MTNRITSSPAFDMQAWRERFLRNVLRFASVFGIVLIGAAFQTASFTDRILFVSLYIILLTATFSRRAYVVRAYFLLVMITIVGANAILSWGPWADGNIFLLASVALSSLLLDNKTDRVVLIGSFIFLVLVAFFNSNGTYQLSAPDVPPVDLASWRIYIADFSIISLIIVAAANMLKGAFYSVFNEMQSVFEVLKAERTTLEEKVQERTSELESRMLQLRASTTTARAIAETQEITSLLDKAAHLIAERFDYSHVGVYILDEQRRIAFLQSASSPKGISLIGQSLRLDVDRRNPLSLAVEKKRTIISSDADPVYFQADPNFPLTRSRMVMPLTVRGILLGLLDIHSEKPQAFTQQDAEILQTLADLTAISFDNVRLLEETRNLLSQLNASASHQTRKTWSKLTSRHKSAYQYTPAGIRPIFTSEKQSDTERLSIPIVLQGQPIGSIRLKKRKGLNAEWSEREKDLVEKISAQVALALENSRLVDEAQKNALRNQMIANFSTHVRETLDIDVVIRTAAAELRKVFDLKEAEILIGHVAFNSSQQNHK